jgi:hypothetical protein
MSRGLGNDLYTSNSCEDPPPPSATLQSRPEALTLPVCTMYLSLLYSITHTNMLLKINLLSFLNNFQAKVTYEEVIIMMSLSLDLRVWILAFSHRP